MRDRAMDTGRTEHAGRRTNVRIEGGRWLIDGIVTYPTARAEGLLMNARMVNAVFEDSGRPDFDPDANTARFVHAIPEYVEHGIRAFTMSLQGGFPGYEGAFNSAFRFDGSLRAPYLRRVARVVDACDAAGAVVILSCFYRRQDKHLDGDDAVRKGVENVIDWIDRCGYGNVVLEVANEFGHPAYTQPSLRDPEGTERLIRHAKARAPHLIVSASRQEHRGLPPAVADAVDVILIHFNQIPVDRLPHHITGLKRFGKPIVCNEDAKVGPEGATAAELCVEHGISWGLMQEEVNQKHPFRFLGAADDDDVYRTLMALTSSGIDDAAARSERTETPDRGRSQ